MRRLLLSLLIGGAVYAAGALVIEYSAHPGPDGQTTAPAAYPTAKPAAAPIVSSWPSEPGQSNSAESTYAEVFTRPRGQAPLRWQSRQGNTMWAKVSSAAELRSGASSYAAPLQSFAVGTELEVMWRKTDGWVQVANPATSTRGWMREENLAWVIARGRIEPKSVPATAEAPTRVEASIAEPDAPPVKKKSRRAPQLVAETIGPRAADRQAAANSDDQWQGSYGRGRQGPLALFGLF